jgi:hypothetical protein
MKSFFAFYEQVRNYNEAAPMAQQVQQGPAYDPNTGRILNQDALRQNTVQGMRQATQAGVQNQQMMQQAGGSIPEMTRQAIQQFEKLLPHKKQLQNMGQDPEVKQFLAKYPPQVQTSIQKYYQNQQSGLVAKGEAPAPQQSQQAAPVQQGNLAQQKGYQVAQAVPMAQRVQQALVPQQRVQAPAQQQAAPPMAKWSPWQGKSTAPAAIPIPQG